MAAIFIFCMIFFFINGLSVAQPSHFFQRKGRRILSIQTSHVRLRRRSHLLLKMKRDHLGRPMFEGILTDDRGRPLREQPLQLQAPDGQKYHIKTDTQGRFQLLALALPSTGNFILSFKGNHEIAPSSIRRYLEVGKVDFDLNVLSKKQFVIGSKRIEIEAHASFKGKPLEGIPLSLFWDSREVLSQEEKDLADEIPHSLRLATVHTDAEGRAQFIWKGEALMQPMELSFFVKYRGNSFFLPQIKRVKIRIVPPGQKISQKTHKRHLAFKRQFLLFIFFLLILLPIIFWKIFLFSRSSSQHSKPSTPFFLPSLEEEKHHKKAHDFVVSGQILDRQTRHPIDGVEIWKYNVSKEQTPPQTLEDIQEKATFLMKTDKEGRFEWRGEKPEEFLFYFRHPHYRDKSFTFHVPHHGQGRHLKIQMQSYRLAIFEIYQKAVLKASFHRYFDPRKVTSREILSQLTPKIAQHLVPLAKHFEFNYYSPKKPDKKDYQKALQLLLDFESNIAHLFD